MQEANARIENTIRTIKEAQAEKEKTRQARQELADFRQSMEALAAKEQEEKIARKIEKLKEKQNRKKEKKANKGQENMLSAQASAEQQARKEAERLAAIVPGSNVRIKGQTSVGEVMEVNGKNATVAFGSIKTTVKLDRLERTNAQPKPDAKYSQPLLAHTWNWIWVFFRLSSVISKSNCRLSTAFIVADGADGTAVLLVLILNQFDICVPPL